MAIKKSTSRTSSKKSKRIEMENDYFDNFSPQINNKLETTFKINSKFKNEKQKNLYNDIIDKNNRVIFVKGVAGSGKTYVSLMAALQCLKDTDYNISKIILSKIIVPAGSDIGFLRGQLDEKVAPYFVSYWANVHKLIGAAWGNKLKAERTIEEVIINYMRGITFGTYDSSGTPIGTISILDEAQNTTVNEMKTFISRLGEGSKLIIMGDSDQVDIKLKRDEKNGLDDAFERFQNIDGIKFHEFNEDDIVRDKFLIEIMKRYRSF